VAARCRPPKALAFNNPDEDLYFKSINTTVDRYRAFLMEVRTNSLLLPNCDLDSGNATKAAEYSLADDGVCEVARPTVRTEVRFDHLALRDNILNFYADLSAPIETKKGQGSLAKSTDCAGSVEVKYPDYGPHG